MKQFVKTFDNYYSGKIDNKINAFLKDHPTYKIAFITLNPNSSSCEVMIVFDIEEEK